MPTGRTISMALLFPGRMYAALLAKMIRDDLSNEAMRFRDVRQTFVGGVPVLLLRISFSGELGYEIYCAPQFQLAPLGGD